MPRDDLHGRFVERNSKQIGRLARKRHNIGSHPRGFGIDINPDDPGVWHGGGCADDETCLRPALPVLCTMAADAEPKRAACDSISEIVVA